MEGQMASEKLEDRLVKARTPAQRRQLLGRLVTRNAQEIFKRARLRARVLGLKLEDGDVAVSLAFIKLAQKSSLPWPAGRTFLGQFDYWVWSELRHRRTRLAIRSRRFLSRNSAQPAADSGAAAAEGQARRELVEVCGKLAAALPDDPTRRLLHAKVMRLEGFAWQIIVTDVAWPGSADQLRREVGEVRFEGRERLLLAWLLHRLQYGWSEIKVKTDWPGSPNSLRVSVYKLRCRLATVPELSELFGPSRDA